MGTRVLKNGKVSFLKSQKSIKIIMCLDNTHSSIKEWSKTLKFDM